MTRSLRGVFSTLIIILPVAANTILAAGQIAASVEKLSFDTATHRFSFSWQIDTTEIPVGCEGAFSLLCGTASTLPSQPDNPFPVTARSGDTSIIIDQLAFDTTYRVGMWLRIQGIWYPPDTSALSFVTVPEASWEPVRLFNNTVADTFAVLARQVLIWRDASYGSSLPPHSIIVRKYDPAISQLNGFLSVSQGITFVDSNPVSLPPFFIGFRVDAPSKIISGSAIYRDSSGHLLVEHQTVRDTVRRIVFVKTSRTDLPFVVLADTLPPRIELTTDTGSVIGPDPIEMAFTIRDNSSGCRWQLSHCSAGERPFVSGAQFSGTLRDTAGKISCQIPVTGAGEAGLRVHLIFDDGAHADTINISRQTARVRCNETTTPGDMILPLAPGAVLERTGCTDALGSLFERSGGSYAVDRFRLYAWQPSAPAGGWAEFSPGNSAAFAFLPGKLYWLITRDATPLDFGDGRSVSLKDTLVVELPPRAWTDFSSPYSFPVAFDDIIAASGESASHISCYQWQKDESHRTWRAEPLFNRSVPGLDALSTVLSYGTNGYFTVYNPTDSPISMRIPPVPPAKKTAKTTPCRTTATGWTIRFDLERNGSTCASVLCAVSPAAATAHAFPAPPSFSGSSISANAPGTTGKNGIFVFPADNRTAPTFELTVTNTDAAKADFVIVPRRIAGTTSGAITDESATRDIGQQIPLTIGARQTKRLIFRAGTEAWGGRTTPSLPGIASPARILSASAGRSGIALRIDSHAPVNHIEIFDPTGRKRGELNCGPLSGGAVIAGDLKSLTSGVVIVRLTTRNERGIREHHLTKTVQVR